MTPVGQPDVVLAAFVPTTSATFPSVADILIVPVASVVGSATPHGAFPNEAELVAASCTRKYWPGASVPDEMFVLLVELKVPLLEAYCSE